MGAGRREPWERGCCSESHIFLPFGGWQLCADQWRTQRRGPEVGGGRPALFLDQNEARRVEKFFLRPDPPYPRIWMSAPSPPEGLDPQLLMADYWA